MKIIKISLSFIATLVLLANLSCKKDHTGTETGTQNTFCRIDTIYDNDEAAAVWFTYGEGGRIVEEALSGFVLTYQYGTNTIEITRTYQGAFSSKTTITVNRNGFVTDLHIDLNEAGSQWQEDKYEYEGGTKVMKHISTSSSGSAPFVQTFTWANGNIASIETGTGQKVTYSYYADIPSQPGDYFSYFELLGAGGAKVYDNQNALKSYLSGDVTTAITYQRDADEKITGFSYTTEGPSGISPALAISYSYQCE